MQNRDAQFLNSPQNSDLDTLKKCVEEDENYLQALTSYLEKKGDIDYTYSDGNTLLHTAATRGNDKAVSLLLERKADPFKRNKTREWPINTAAESGKWKTVNLFLADSQEYYNNQHFRKTGYLLYQAIYENQTDVAETLILNKASTTYVCKNNHTALRVAFTNIENEAIFKLLLENKADLSVKYKNKDKKIEQTTLESILIAEAKPFIDIITEHIRKAKDHELAKQLLETQNKVKNPSEFNSILMSAVHDDQPLPIISHLLAANASPNQITQTGLTLLHICVKKTNSQTIQALLESKADPHLVDKNGHYPIDYAAHSEKWPLVRLLLEKGTPRYQDYGYLLYAVTFYNQTNLAKQLISENVPVTYISSAEGTALRNASNKNNVEVFTLLLEKKADVNIIQNKKTTLEDILDKNKWGCLSAVTRHADTTANTLLQQTLQNQLSSKLYSTTNGTFNTDTLPTIKILLHYKANPNVVPTEQSKSPLALAMSLNNWKLIDLFATHIADSKEPKEESLTTRFNQFKRGPLIKLYECALSSSSSKHRNRANSLSDAIENINSSQELLNLLQQAAEFFRKPFSFTKSLSSIATFSIPKYLQYPSSVDTSDPYYQIINQCNCELIQFMEKENICEVETSSKKLSHSGDSKAPPTTTHSQPSQSAVVPLSASSPSSVNSRILLPLSASTSSTSAVSTVASLTSTQSTIASLISSTAASLTSSTAASLTTTQSTTATSLATTISLTPTTASQPTLLSSNNPNSNISKNSSRDPLQALSIVTKSSKSSPENNKKNLGKPATDNNSIELQSYSSTHIKQQ